MCRLQMLNPSIEEDAAMTAAADAVLSASQANEGPSPHGTRGAARRGRGKSVASGSAADVCQVDQGALLQGIYFLAMEDACEHVLHEIKPVFVVLYDLDLSWIRQLEVYKALYKDRPLKVRMIHLCDI
jgi:hypothetical protein